MKIKKIKILFVEDNEDDFALMLRELKIGKLEIVYELTQDEKGFRSALGKKWDIIISDFSLPSFTGLEALKIYNEAGLDIPFIIVSGTVGEDIAVDMMKAGAKDYIMKKSLKRLIPAIERELEEAKIRKRNKLIALEREVLFQIGKDLIKTDNLDNFLNRIYTNIKKILYADNFFIALFNSCSDEISFPFFIDKYEAKPPSRKSANAFTEFVIHSGKSYLLNSNSLEKLAKENKFDLIGKMCESVIGVPLTIHTKSIGAIVIQSYDKDKIYNEFDRNFLEAIAADIAMAIERKRAEDELRENELRFTQIAENAGDWIWEVDKDGLYTYASPVIEKILGYRPEEVMGKKYFYDLFLPESREEIKKAALEIFNSRKPIKNLVNVNIHKDGSIVYLETNGTPIVDEKNNLIGYRGVDTNITERKLSEDAIRKSELQLSNALRIAHAGHWEYDVASDTFTFNDNFYRIFKTTAEEVGGYTMTSTEYARRFCHPDDMEMVQKETINAIKAKDPNYNRQLEHRIKYANGEIGYILVRFFIEKDSNGNTIKTYGINQEITERKKSEEALKESEERYRVFINSTNDMAFLKDDKYRYILVNKANAKFFNKDIKDIIGKDDYELMPEESAKHCRKTDNNALSTDSIIVNEENVGDRIYETHKFRVPLSGKKFGIGGYIRDITERKWAEENLRKSEEHYRTLLTAIPDLMFRLDKDGRFMDYHAEETLVLFAPPEKFLGKHYKEILPPNVSKKFDSVIKEVKKTGQLGIFDYELVLPNKEMHYFEARVTCYESECVAIIRDITEQKNAEKAMRESEEHFKNIVRNAEAAYFRINKDGFYEDVNNSWLRMHKFSSPDEVIGKHFSITQIEQDFEKAKKNIDELLKGKPIDTGEISRKCKDGSIGYHSYSISPIITKGQVTGVEGFLIDITEQKNTLEALNASQERYRILVETMNEGLILVDNDDVIQFVNKRECDIFGYEPEELIGRVGNEIMIAEEDRKIILEKKKLRLNSFSDSYEVRAIRKNGEMFWININGAPVKDSDGIVIGSVGIITDITERKQVEEELKKLSRAVEQSFVSIIITDYKGDIEYVNPKFVSSSGYNPEEVIGKNPKILKSGETTKEKYKELWNTILSGNDWVGEFRNRKKNGELFWESIQISPVKNAIGEITHFIAIKEDITDKKQKEIELLNAKEKAEESERLKSSFLANMSHELRTPMVGILGFADLLIDMAENPEIKDFADNISKSGKRLLETLNLILDLSRIEAGKLEIKTSEVDIVQLTKEVYENYVPEAEKKNIKIKFLPSEKQIVCKVDERMIYESVNNLLNNAIKYTKAGEVSAEIELNRSKDKVLIRISDTGIGIPKNSINVIFEEFRQVSEGYSRGFEGTGLGLTITKNFIIKNGGSIYVESEIGIGSTFTIELPVLKSYSFENKRKVPIEEKEMKDILKMKKDINLLCVDDDSFTREYLGYVLQNYYNVSFAENGYDAIEIAKTKKFSVILMDINLGKGIDGIETARKIHKLPGYENTPVIALTAFAMKGDKEEFLNSGMKDYVSKPFKSNELINIIEEVIKNSDKK